MQKVKLIFIHPSGNPTKQFLVCSIDDKFTFADPLHLFKMPLFDIYDVNDKGLYAIGGTIDVDTLLRSYKFGIFPWFPYKCEHEPYWYCPRERYVLFPEETHVGHSLRNLLNKGKYHVTINKAFREVIHNCRIVNGRSRNKYAWLGKNIEDTFIELNELGYAKSIEVWEGDKLAGGFYGFWYNGVFQGESMFSLKPSASQIGLVLLCKNPFIEGRRIKLIDTQFETPTFKRLGARYISYELYRYIMDNSQEL